MGVSVGPREKEREGERGREREREGDWERGGDWEREGEAGRDLDKKNPFYSEPFFFKVRCPTEYANAASPPLFVCEFSKISLKIGGYTLSTGFSDK